MLIKKYFDRVLPRCSPLWRNTWQTLWTQKGCQQSSRECPGRGGSEPSKLPEVLQVTRLRRASAGACAVRHRAHHSPTHQRSAVLVHRA